MGNVRDSQKVETCPDGSTRTAGIMDRNWINTDHVPMPVEGVSNTTWGEKDSGRRDVKTAGKEKDRFTAQLSCAKDGTKSIPFVIFCAAHFLYTRHLPAL